MKKIGADDCIIPEIKECEITGARIFDANGKPICDVGYFPFGYQPDGAKGDEEVIVKFNEEGTVKITIPSSSS